MVDQEDPAGLDRPPVPAVAEPESREAKAESYRIWQPPVLRERVRVITPSEVGEDRPAPPKPAAHDAGRRSTFGEPSSSDSGISATERGNRIHQLLQWASALGSMPPGVGPIHTEAATVFEHPDLTWIFKPENGRGLSEVPVIHRRQAASADKVEERVLGSIDRLVFGPGRVDIIDFKSDRIGGDPADLKTMAEHHQPQLEAYREVIAALYPDRQVYTWLLFTDPACPDSEKLVEVTR